MKEVMQDRVEDEPPLLENVVALYPGATRTRRIPPLSNSEILRLRKMLDDFDKIKSGCPLAQRFLAGS